MLTQADGKTPLWNASDAWTPVTPFRQRDGAKTAILTIGAPSYLAGEASEKAAARGVLVDVYVVNGFPIDEAFIADVLRKYKRIVTLEDGLIGTVGAGLRGFAAYVAGKAAGNGKELDHFGIVDPQHRSVGDFPGGLGALRDDERRDCRADRSVSSRVSRPGLEHAEWSCTQGAHGAPGRGAEPYVKRSRRTTR